MDNRVSVVLLNYNGHTDTVPCLESLLKSDYPIEEVVIVDNNSSDNSVELITNWLLGKSNHKYIYDKECFPLEKKPIEYSLYYNSEYGIKLIKEDASKKKKTDITIIQNYSNDGFSAGNNVALKYLMNKKADIIWLLNNDTIVKKNSLSQMIKLYNSLSDKRAIIGSCLYYNDRRDVIQAFGGGCVNFITGKVYSMEKPGNVDYITGASLLIPALGFSEIGLLDEKYFMYWEDSDYSMRAKKKKWTIRVASDSIIFHKHNSSADRENNKSNYFRDVCTAKGALRFFIKHAGVLGLIPIFFRMISALFKRIRKSSFREFLVIILKVLLRLGAKKNKI
ncbi:MAG TPA: glycosyltransferase family 2 protein [Spirochaetota bacterium]|nr:glycosyltransferase family 2 protein [Spirochaetota bacterium]HPK57480.1 glycosyltransferase family 2 protein [Spirochaetota bacterium]